MLPLKEMRLRVYLGGLVSKDLLARKVGVKQVHVHPSYRGLLTNDIALLEMSESVEQSHAVSNTNGKFYKFKPRFFVPLCALHPSRL